MRTRFEAATQSGLTPYTGRDGEMVILRGCLEKAISGSGQLVTIIGEAGVGKSRLVYEFRRHVDRNRIAIWEGRCQSYGAETPYLPLLDGLRRALRIHEESDPTVLHEKAVANLLAIDPALERYLPHLLRLLSIPSADHRLPETLQGEALRRELEEALAATIAQSAQHQPLVLIYEDWHWADDASDSALNNIVTLVGHYPLMVIVLYRPEYTRRWTETEHYTAIVLHYLDVANTGAMLRSILGTTVLPDALAPAVHARTAGNALFNEEMAHALRDEGIVEVANGRARLTKPLEDVQLPDSIHAVIRSRVDRLEPADREVLRLASVIGREFDRDVLETIASGREMVSQALVRLARQDLIHQVRVLPQAEFIFKHVLTQVVVYETLLIQQRKKIHALVGRAIEEHYADRLDEHVEDLAHHFSRSAVNEKAIHYLELAGDKAAGLFSLTEARNHYRQAKQLLSSTEDSPESMRQAVEVTVKWGSISNGMPTEDLAIALQESVTLAEKLQDKTLLAKASGFLGYMCFLRGDYKRCRSEAERVIGMASEVKDDDIIGLGYRVLGSMYSFGAKFPKAVEPLNKAIELLDRAKNWHEVGMSAANLGWAYMNMGEFDQCYKYYDMAISCAQTHSVRSMEVLPTAWLATAKGYQGDFESAIALSDRAIQIAWEVGDIVAAYWANIFKGYIGYMAGDSRNGIYPLREGMDKVKEFGVMILMSLWHGWLAEILLELGQIEEAKSAAEESLGYGETGDRYGEHVANRVLGAVFARPPFQDWAKCESHFAKSVRIAEGQKARPEIAMTRFRHAEALEARGDLERAGEELAQATALFRKMDMAWWLGKADELRSTLDPHQVDARRAQK